MRKRFWIGGGGLLACLTFGAWISTQLGPAETRAEASAISALEQTQPNEIEAVLAARANAWAVPSYSVTVMDRDEADAEPSIQSWHGGNGGEDALFQAASLSKSVAAAGILILADQRGIGLDDDIRPLITSLNVSALPGGDRVVTLRQLLSHTAGATVSGYPGNPRDAVRPSTAEVIIDPPSLITPGVKLTGSPGAFAYSGGGYTLAQLFAEDISGEAFAPLMKRLILDPLGMTRSGFDQPIDPTTAPGRVIGSTTDRAILSGIFTPLEESWHIYPQQAAAGLWTTSEDYARFLAAIQTARSGAPSPLPESVAQVMTHAEAEAFGAHYGLGLSLKMGSDGTLRQFGHSGSNAGYRALARADTQTGRIVVSLTNAASGTAFNEEAVAGLLSRP